MPKFDHNVPTRYIEANYEPEDRVAIVLIQRSTGRMEQNIRSAFHACHPEYQAYLRAANAHGADVYISQNTLNDYASGRTKADVAEIRHLYLDLDKDGKQSLERIMNDPKMPEPHHILESSPGKYQTIWSVEGYRQEQAEATLRGMAHEYGGDPAATDSTRVLRVPGFRNCKYPEPHYVRDVQNAKAPDIRLLLLASEAQNRSYHPSDFPAYSAERPKPAERPGVTRLTIVGGSQSEKDFGYACRKLELGVDPESIKAQIAYYRQDKPNPAYYANITVQKAQTQVAGRPGPRPPAAQISRDGGIER